MKRLDPSCLATLPYLKGAAAQELTAFALYFHGRSYAPNDVVFSEGDPGASMLVVTEGTLLGTSRSLGPQNVRRYAPGQALGEETLFVPTPRSMTLLAVTPASVFALDHETFEPLRRSLPRIARVLADTSLHTLMRRLKAVEQRVEADLDRAMRG